MKKTTLAFFISFLAALQISFAQLPELWGMTYLGGPNSEGWIVKINGDGTGFDTVYAFTYAGGGAPASNLVKGPNGDFYGLTTNGGINDYGVIFSFDPTSNVYTNLHDFDLTNGANPYASLLLASDGKFYGVTENGGAQTAGVIFSFDPVSKVFSKLYDFTNTAGGYPHCTFIQPAGTTKLYGTTINGGAKSNGVIFSYDISSGIYSDLHDFDGSAGGQPKGKLLQAKNGKMYGLTFIGNPANGILFSFDPSNNNFANLVNFTNTNGAFPCGGLMQASDDKLYGMTSGGGIFNSNGLYKGDGVLFSYDPSTSIYTKLHDFDSINGSGPQGDLIQASDGKLYGMTHDGGSSKFGVIFSFDPSTKIYSKLKDFDLTNGGWPSGDLYQINNTGFGELAVNDYQLIIFPNPASSQFTITASHPLDKIEVKNVLGQTLLTFPSLFSRKSSGNEQSQAGYSIQINTNELPPGIYFVRITVGADVITSKVVVK